MIFTGVACDVVFFPDVCALPVICFRGLDQLATATGVDRFRLTRAFKAAYGMAPHAYLVQLRLATARRMLARGEQPAAVAMELGFADQSHLGRWFMRTYGLTPALYRKRCSNLPDRSTAQL